ncbi:MAG: GNAT family N-acetyltransferase [Clostridiales bacterium]|nr:GNAT family N-acetyltransferase [Clostridiales bacterium]
MNVFFENYNPEKHDKHVVAELMYNADVEINTLFFGGEIECLTINEELINLEKQYLASKNIVLAMIDDKIVGLALGIDVSYRDCFDKKIGKAIVEVMGFWYLLRKMYFFFIAKKINEGTMDNDAHFIHTLSVSSFYRGRGIGAELIKMMAKRHSKLYLHVNINNNRGQKFYEKMGFEQKERNVILHKGKEIGTYLMLKK